MPALNFETISVIVALLGVLIMAYFNHKKKSKMLKYAHKYGNIDDIIWVQKFAFMHHKNIRKTENQYLLNEYKKGRIQAYILFFFIVIAEFIALYLFTFHIGS